MKIIISLVESIILLEFMFWFGRSLRVSVKIYLMQKRDINHINIFIQDYIDSEFLQIQEFEKIPKILYPRIIFENEHCFGES